MRWVRLGSGENRIHSGIPGREEPGGETKKPLKKKTGEKKHGCGSRFF